MRISVDRAIRILDPEHREHYESLDEVNEACRMGMEALKALRWLPANDLIEAEGDLVIGWVSRWMQPRKKHPNE